MTKDQFHNALRIMRSIDSWELPTVPREQIDKFIADRWNVMSTIGDLTNQPEIK